MYQAMQVAWYIIITATATAGTRKTVEVQAIKEVVIIEDKINIDTYRKHGKLLLDDIKSNAKDQSSKLIHLIAIHTINEITMLINAILQKQKENRRQKRNVIGNVIHLLTGLATDDDLQRQLQLDKQIRDQVLQLLSQQTTYEEKMTNAMHNFTMEEEQIYKILTAVRQEHAEDRQYINRVVAQLTVLEKDLQKLRRTLETVWTKKVTVQQTVEILTKINIIEIVPLELESINITDKRVTLTYIARIFTKERVQSIEIREDIQYVEINDDIFIFDKAKQIEENMKIDEKEVRKRQEECQECARIGHIGHSEYKVLKNGIILCEKGIQKKQINITTDMKLTIDAQEICYNRYMQVGMRGIKRQKYEIDEGRDDDYYLEEMKKKIKTTSLIDKEKFLDQHEKMNRELKQDLIQIGRNAEIFKEKTEQEIVHAQVTGGTSAIIWIIVIATIIIAVIFAYFRDCCKKEKKQTEYELGDGWETQGDQT